MTEPTIRTARHTIRVAAPPKRVYQLIAHVDRWPQFFDSIVAVEHVGFEGTSERIRFWKKVGGSLQAWTSARELNPKRLQVRFRQVNLPQTLASLGGLWLVVPKGNDAMIVLDHYYRVAEDHPVSVRRVEADIAANSTAMLESLRRTAEYDRGAAPDLLTSFSDSVNAEGVIPL